MRRLAGWVLLALASFSMPAAPAWADDPWPEDCKLHRITSLPFVLQHGHVDVEAKVNDVARTFLVDTGGFYSAISASVVEEQKLPTYHVNSDLKISGIGGQPVEQYAVADTLAFGTARASHVQLLIQPQHDFAEDGLIAPEYLRNFDLEFDFANKVLNLFKPHPCNDHVVYWGTPYVALPFHIVHGHIRVTVTLDGVPLSAMLDTGSPATMIGTGTALKFSDAPVGAPVEIHGFGGGSVSASPRQFHALDIGGLTITNPTLLVADDKSTIRFDGSPLLLGLRELRKFHLYIAYREQKIYLSPQD